MSDSGTNPQTVSPESEQEAARAVREALRCINQAWRSGHPEYLEGWFHPSIVAVHPGFAQRAEGRQNVVASFAEFCRHARVEAFEESDHQVDVFGSTSVASFAFTMVYCLADSRYRSSSRDLWIFTLQDDRWLAAWRTMIDVTESPV